MAIGAEDGMMRSMSMGPAEGPANMKVTMSNLKFGVDLPENAFEFTPPDGVEVMDMTEMMEQAEAVEEQNGRFAMGDVAPDFVGKTVDLKTVKLSDYAGKVVLIDFWATWCGPCIQELPNVIDAYEQYHPKGLEIIGVSLDDEQEALETFLGKNPKVTWLSSTKAWAGTAKSASNTASTPSPTPSSSAKTAKSSPLTSAAKNSAKKSASCSTDFFQSCNDCPRCCGSLFVSSNWFMKSEKAALLRMDNIGIVVESLDEVISFFTELGLKLEGRAMIEGEWAGRVTGLGDQRVEIAMMVTPDGHSRLELSRFLAPPVVADHRNAPVNSLGYLRAMFTVTDIDDTLARLQKHGAQLVDEVVQYKDAYRLCYIRGPEGLLIGLAEPLNATD